MVLHAVANFDEISITEKKVYKRAAMQSRSFIFSYVEQNFENNKGQYDPPNLAHLLICSMGSKGFI